MFNNVIWGYSFGKKFQMWNAGAVSLALHSLRRMAGNSSGHAAELKLSSIMASMMSTSLNSIPFMCGCGLISSSLMFGG